MCELIPEVDRGGIDPRANRGCVSDCMAAERKEKSGEEEEEAEAEAAAETEMLREQQQQQQRRGKHSGR